MSSGFFGGVLVSITRARPFTDFGAFVIGGDFFTADAASGIIYVFTEDGSMREIYRASQRESVPREIPKFLEHVLAMPGREAPADVFEDLRTRLGDRRPAWEKVLADPEGRVWLKRPECPPYVEQDSFDLVGLDGNLLGSVAFPRGVRVLAVRGDDVLVMRTDSLDVAHVEMYRLMGAEGTR